MNRKTLLSVIFVIITAAACVPTEKEKIVEKEVIKEVIKEVEKEVIVERMTLQNVIDNANDGEEIDLSKYDNITNYTATVNKQLTIKNGSLKNARLTIEADKVELAGLKDLKLTTSEKLGSGSLTIRDSELSDLLLLGGGSNSVYILGTSSVVNLTMNYTGVRTLLGDGVEITNLTMQKDGIIQSQPSYKGLIENFIIEGISTLANVGGGSENNAGGNLNITKIQFKSENSQINLGGDIIADNIESLATSRIITNNFDLTNKNISVSESATLNTTLTIIKTAKMTPKSLMVIGFEPDYIIGETLDKNAFTVMEETVLSGDAVMYKKGATGEETVETIWLKKTDFDVKIIKNGTEIGGLTFPTNAGLYTVKITCDELTFEQDVNVIHPSEKQGDLTIGVTEIKDPTVSLYINDENGNYNNLDTNVKKPSGVDNVPTLIATATLPAGYTVNEWRLNNEVLANNDSNIQSVLITLPLSKKEIVDMLQPGENILSVIVQKQKEDKDNEYDYKSGFLKFHYVTPKTNEQ